MDGWGEGKKLGLWERRKDVWTDERKQISLEETERAIPEV